MIMSPLDRDKETFLWHLIDIDWKPDIWWDEDYLEIGIEWISENRSRHAVVTLDGDGGYSYCLLGEDGWFHTGNEFNPPVSRFADDLREYLK
jgi:hypothetical protein